MTHPSDEQLNDYFERQLSPADYVEVSRHLDVCPDCALVVAELQEIVREAASLAPMTPPAHVWNQIESRLRPTSNELRLPPNAATATAAKAGGQKTEATGTWRTQWGPVWALATAALV